GFRGPIYTHPATKDLARILLKDSAFLHEKETEWENRKRERKGLPLVEPLYTQQDAAAAIRQFKVLHYTKPTEILPGVTVCLHDAGHILGSAIVELKLSAGGITRTVVFSGDLGHIDAPILRDPVRLEHADLVVMESTYGDRLHRPWHATREELIEVIAAARHNKGNILIPAFAVGRSQLLLYWFARYFEEANLNNWRVFLDSPLAIEASNIYVRHSSLYDEVAAALWEGLEAEPLLPNLRLTRTTKQSKAINLFRSGAIIIAGSGMCTGGRIKHHLLNNVWRKQCHVIIVGYQAYGTPGRAMVDGAKYIRLYGETVRVAAAVHTIGGLSAHADPNGMVNWYAHFAGRPRVLLVHGEQESMDVLAQQLRAELNAPVEIASKNNTIDLVETTGA
ncbi:MAG: MBL fold metallo-hydrolase RNA specificity domain-containing protein, partial [Pseudomonadales bacterium]